ncbi:hypothetical protein ACFLV7_12930 [Chloroflexota bacterium]
MLDWQTHKILCNITIDHQGLPTNEEINQYCGNELTTTWQTTPACDLSKGCRGAYLHLASSQIVTNQTSQETEVSSPPLLDIQQLEPKTYVDTCALIWQSPPTFRPPWLAIPSNSISIATYNDYYYLAGRLIGNGLVNASNCPSGGLRGNGYANECGMDAARDLNIFWQNQFDTNIIDDALEVGIPATMLKNLFAQESQFWPGTFIQPYQFTPRHFGLGQITNPGVDVLLMYDTNFYNETCKLFLSKETCSVSYVRLSRENKDILRGAVVAQVNADCPECVTGVDLERTKLSISLTAQVLVANCIQIGEIVSRVTLYNPGSVATYEDLWRFTIGNYHVGSGRMANAINKSWNKFHVLTWSDVAPHIKDEDVIRYVDNLD